MLAAKRIVISMLLLILLLVTGCGQVPADTASEEKTTPAAAGQDRLVIAGSGSNILITSKLAEAYRLKTGVAIEIPESIGSTGAINAVTAGKLELGLVSRPLLEEERDAGLKEIPYARIAVTFAAHHAVADSNVTSDEVNEILEGKKTTWSDGSKIYIFTRQDSDSTNLILYNLIPGYQAIVTEANRSHRWQTIYRNSDMSDALKKTTGSFGLTTLPEICQPNSGIKALALDGVAPNRDNVLEGRYKPVVILSFVYKQELGERAARWIDFVFSQDGQQILNDWEAIPIGR